MPHARNAYFTGRDQALKDLHDALTRASVAALTQPHAISGLGGIGKTQVAIEFAYRYGSEYKAVLWVRADSRQALISDFIAIAGLLNLPQKDIDDHSLAVAAVKRWLESNKGWLVILDNADDPKQIQEFLPVNPQGRILLTSRAQVFDYLGTAMSSKLEEMFQEEAHEFLLKRTSRNELEPAERQAVAELAKDLGYLPLALEQAVALSARSNAAFKTTFLAIVAKV